MPLKTRRTHLCNIKPQLAQRYRLKDTAIANYREVLKTETDLNGWELNIIAEAVIERVIEKFRKDMSPQAASVIWSDSHVCKSMLSEAAVIADQMDEAGELESILNAAQDRMDGDNHDI